MTSKIKCPKCKTNLVAYRFQEMFGVRVGLFCPNCKLRREYSELTTVDALERFEKEFTND